MLSNRINLKIVHKGAILVLVPLFFELIFLGVLTELLHRAEVEVQRQVRSKAIISQANTLSKLFYDAGVAMGGYSITKSPLFSDRYDKIVRQIPEDLEELRKLVGDNPKQKQILENLQKITVTGLKILGEAKSAIDDNRVDVAQFRARHMYKEIRSLADKLQDELRGLTEDERRIEQESPEKQNRSRTILKVFLVGGVVANILIAFVLLWFFTRSIKNRLDVLTDNSFRLARGQPLNPPVGGGDEISHLDGVFHSMADALTEAHRKEKAVIDNAVDVICSIDMDGKFVAVNPACYENWGYTPDELLGKRFIEVIAPQDISDTIKAVRAIRAEKSNLQFDNRVRRKDSSEINVSWSAYWSEKERAMFCVAHDITERKLAEEAIRASEHRIRTIINHMIVGLVIVNQDGYIESMNPSAEKIFGYKAEEIVGRHLLSLFSDSKFFSEHNESDTTSFMDTLFNQALNRIGEFDCIKKNGEDFPVELSISELKTHEGERYMANILDVSERKEVERLKKEFVSTVSHELRTPLTSIRGSLTLLSVGAMGALPEQAKKVVSIAERNTIRLIGLINDILDIEKLEAGKLDMVFENTNMKDIMERSEQSVNTFAANNGVKLEMMPTDAQVYADGDRIVQVLVNLLSNAIKFSPQGQTVTVAVENAAGFVHVRVIDRGRGIPEQFKKLLFQRFQQVEASDAKKKGGTGLGLAICKGIIEQHGGQIGVDSEEGKGSTFWFRLPPARTDSTVVVQAQETRAS
ncbi:MAG: PAS domain S-box protein [Cyanobacteriota/Melainabacteria group bacterium]|nr:PAS domain S-box protein [Cyanobacteria bacterium HKST-UBA01]MCB9468448.1 PAS domain S-box protein [Candidatus Obscuribacterales bacterium]